jgi:N6-adenosine-specific RNA methylase IME4
LGYYTRSNAEICVLATKGSPSRLANDVHQVVTAAVGEHSAKPEEVRDRIERLFPGPYLELYARMPAPNWTVWGNEIPRADFAPPVPSEAPPDDGLEIPPGLRRVAE